MPKGQLSRVPWPGSSWMSFTFQPALQVLQQPHKHSYSLQLYSYSHSVSIALHSVCSMCSFWFLKLSPATSKHQNDTWRTTSHIGLTHPPCLFQLPSLTDQQLQLTVREWCLHAPYLLTKHTICWPINVILSAVQKNHGLLALTDEESRFPEANGRSLATKLHNTHSNNTSGSTWWRDHITLCWTCEC